MNVEWDAAKAAANVAKHGVGFTAIEGFEAHVEADMRAPDLEVPLVAVGLIEERLHVAVFVIWRAIRLINLRKANNVEIGRYEDR